MTGAAKGALPHKFTSLQVLKTPIKKGVGLVEFGSINPDGSEFS